MTFTWARRHPNGYELSSKGDKRFSAFYAKMPDGRTIEQHYQCDVKGYDIGGLDWRLGKGNPPLREADLWSEYLALWRVWSVSNSPLMGDLREKAKGKVLTDMFATTEINQAHALAELLNEG